MEVATERCFAVVVSSLPWRVASRVLGRAGSFSRMVFRIAREPVSLESPVGDDDSHLGDFIEDTNAEDPQDAAIYSSLAAHTSEALATLPEREARVLKMRFGIGEREKHTLEEVGQDFDVTRERIRQIEAKALRKLRHPSRSAVLRSFLE